MIYDKNKKYVRFFLFRLLWTKIRKTLCNMVGNKCIRENIRDPYLDFSRRLRVTFKLLLSSHSSKCVMSDF